MPQEAEISQDTDHVEQQNEPWTLEKVRRAIMWTSAVSAHCVPG